MSETGGWEPAFLAVSALLGEPVDVASAALDEAAARAALAGPFGSPSRSVRAAAVARVVAALVAELDGATLA
jgi:hypothetical protein